MTHFQTVSLDDLPPLVERGAVASRQYLSAVSSLRDETFWTRWAVRALFALAVGHILSGIIFFFAFNWNDLSGMMKFAVVGGGIATCLLAWLIAKLDSPMGQAFGIGATVLVGVMFAVLGQVYQTPAMIHTPFVFWAILTLPFALASRNLAHWAVWLVILTVAVSSFANSGLRLGGNDAEANLLNVSVAGGFMVFLVALDKVIAPRMAWARAEWFRVLLVLGAVGFAFVGFTESLWGDNALWLLAFVLVGGLLAYLYRFKPTLATLSLASFGLFTLVAQFGFKLFHGVGEEVGVFFVVFIWLGGLTIGLVSAFRHFVARFRLKGALETTPFEESLAAPQQTSLTSFAQRLGVEAGDIQKALGAAEPTQPWYMSVFLAIAGVLTALLGTFFFGSFLAIVIGFDDELAFGILGVIIFAAAIFARRKMSSAYLQHMLNTMIVIGGLLTVVGFGVEFGDFDFVLGLIFVLSVLVLVSVKDSILEFLAAAAIITVIGMELYHLNVPMVESLVLVMSTGLGVFLISRPIAKRLYQSAGTAFLMSPAILGIALVHMQRWESVADVTRFSVDWLPRAISLAVLLAGVVYLNRGKALVDFNPPMVALIPLLIGAACVPLGGASALLLILTGYILGSRSLAIIGTLLQIYFLTMFYYDLSLGLLTKSIVLFVSGLVFLGVWVFVRRRGEVSS